MFVDRSSSYPRTSFDAGRTPGAEASRVSEPEMKKFSNGENENPEEGYEKEHEISEESNEESEDMIDEKLEEDQEEEVYEESDEDLEDVVEVEPKEDLEAEIDGESEEDPEEEIAEKCDEGLVVENSHDIKYLGNELNEDPEEVRRKKVVQESGNETISKSETPTASCHKHIARPIEDKNQYRLEEHVTGPSSISRACKVGYWLENASKFGSAMLEVCKPQKKFSSEEYLKLKPHVTPAVRDHDFRRPSKVVGNGGQASKQQEHGESSQKHRHSRWDHKQEGKTLPTDGNSKRQKTRWDSGDSQNGLSLQSGLELLMDPKIISLQVKLVEINQKLQSPEIVDERPDTERSPSPEPVYNNLGIRINTRDARIREKLMNERKHILSMIATETSLTFESHVKHKPVKFVKKLFIPAKEYPTYNFIGLILGPKGNTQKKMEKETGAKILLRGKGSGEPDPSEEDLHVLVEADNEGALYAAVAMIEKLLIPVADRENDHKRAQLAQLAKLRGTYKDYNTCDLCKEPGHKKYACPLQDSTFKAVCCDICGSFGHSTVNCSVSISHLISKTLQGSSGVASGTKDKSNKEVDPANLYVGYLSQAIDEKRLKELFLPFGKIMKTTVVKDQSTSLSKGYGFVKFENPSDAAAALTYMNGYKMDDKILAVRIAGQKPGPGSLNSGHVLIPSSHAAVPSNNISGHTPSINGPVIPMPPEAPFSTVNNGSLSFHSTSSYSGQNINVPRTEALDPPYVFSSSTDPRLASKFSSDYDFCDRIPVSLPNSISQFPGHPEYPGSQFKSYFSQQ